MLEVSEYLQRAADRLNFTRERYAESKIPTSHNNLAVSLFFGDIRSEFVHSTFLAHRWISEMHGSKYFVIAGWPGHADLFPYAHEYWGFRDQGALRDLADGALGFGNQDTKRINALTQKFNEWFPTQVSAADLSPYYDGGFTKEFFDRFKWLYCRIPAMPAARLEFNRALAHRPGSKVLIYPVRHGKGWNRNAETKVPIKREFWVYLAEAMTRAGHTPVVYVDNATHDISTTLADKCMYVTDQKLTGAMAAMRATGCVLDVFSGVSRWAITARCPFLAVDERVRFSGVKEYEIDELCASNLQYRYIYSIPTLIAAGNWAELVGTIVAKLNDLVPTLDRDLYPPSSEISQAVPYAKVRKRKSKKFGVRLFKVPKV